MASTDWANVASESTNYSNEYYVSDLGATMNDTAYLMNDTVLTIGDQVVNPIFAPPTDFSNVATNSTNWS